MDRLLYLVDEILTACTVAAFSNCCLVVFAAVAWLYLSSIRSGIFQIRDAVKGSAKRDKEANRT